MATITTNRCKFMETTGMSMVFAALGSASKTKPGRSRKPNVLFIITDDQKLDSFGFINNKALTPGINKLAAEGVYCR